ncbi:hypothetical protein M3589_22365 [Heyndrickxia oleronia]|uniref:hypothetical protein n=1 Tax=Heyndrickxia oleronia TaxID=38875 RepID=UPI00203D4FE0|nr:hypothetical protein [Heyndrickxia oleronia]MCM3240419.1 hypothetical protein [Heyndrickxia oleronia]
MDLAKQSKFVVIRKNIKRTVEINGTYTFTSIRRFNELDEISVDDEQNEIIIVE